MNRTCWNCKKPLIFEEFKEVNYDFSEERLKELWNNPNLEFLCCNCYTKTIREEVKKLLIKGDNIKESLESITNPTILRRYGLICFMRGKVKRAKMAYKRVLELEPSDKNTWKNLGHLYLEEGKMNKAFRAYKNALDLNIETLYDIRDYALFYKIKGNTEKAQELLGKLKILLSELSLLE
ncbi:MAG: tetratricopeptide repeat protein [Promethearchaeota archaeon]